jgi:hypothetical protein
MEDTIPLFFQGVGVSVSVYALLTYVSAQSRLREKSNSVVSENTPSKSNSVIPIYREIALQDRGRYQNPWISFFKVNINTVLLIILIIMFGVLVEYMCEVFASMSSTEHR